MDGKQHLLVGGGGSSLLTNLYSVYKAENNTNDSLGTYNGTAQGGLTYTTGKSGNSFTFNGSTSYVRFPDNTFNSLTGDFSASAWINLQSIIYNDQSLYIINNMQAPSFFNNPYGWRFMLSGNTLLFSIFNNTNTYYNLSYFFNNNGNLFIPNTWYHLVFTRKASTGSKLYINGSLVASDNNTVNPSYTGIYSMTPTIGNLYMGNNGSVINTSYAPAGSKIDELNVWNKELTASEITTLYNSGTGKFYPTF